MMEFNKKLEEQSLKNLRTIISQFQQEARSNSVLELITWYENNILLREKEYKEFKHKIIRTRIKRGKEE